MVFSREWNINLPRVGMLDNRKIRFNQCPVRYTKRLASVFFKLLGVDFGLGRGVISIPDHGLPVDDPVGHGKRMIVNGDPSSRKVFCEVFGFSPVSYTHLTLPTIYSV